MIPCQSHMLERYWSTLECSADGDDDDGNGDDGNGDNADDDIDGVDTDHPDAIPKSR